MIRHQVIRAMTFHPVVAIVALAAVLRFYQLGTWSLCLDEGLQFYESAAPLHTLYKQQLFAQEQPLFFIMAHPLIALGFDDLWSLRTMPALFGCVTVALVYLLARELFDRSAALYAALLTALAPVLIFYSQYFRFYSLFILLTVFSSYAILVAVRTNAPLWWVLFTAAAIASVWTHHVAVTVLIGLGLFTAMVITAAMVFDRAHAKRLLVSATASGCMILLAWLPAVPMLLNARADDAAAGVFAGLPIPTAIQVVLFNLMRLAPVTFAFYALVAIGLVWTALRSARATAFVIASFVPLLVLLVDGSGRMTASARYSAFIMPLLCLCAGVGASAVARALQRAIASRGVVTAAVSIALVLLMATPLKRFYSENQREMPVDTKAAYDHLTRHTMKSDIVLEAVARYRYPTVYFYRSWAYQYDMAMKDKTRTAPAIRTVLDEINFPRLLPHMVTQTGRLWVMLVTDDETLIQPTANFDTTCFRQICVIGSKRADATMRQQIEAFFAEYGNLNESQWAVAVKALKL